MQTPSSFSIPTPDLPPLDDSLILGLLAQQTSTRADNADILAYFEKHADLASRSEFCRTSYKQIYTQLYVGERMAGFIRHDQYLAYLVGSGINPVQLGADAVGNTMRLDNCLHNLPQSVTDLESKLVQLQKQLENAKEQLAQPFAQADELAEKSKRLAELETLLNLNEKDIVLDTVPDEEQQCRSDNRQRGQER